MPEPTLDWSFDDLMENTVKDLNLEEIQYDSDCINFRKQNRKDILAVQVPMKLEESHILTDLLNKYFEGVDSTKCNWWADNRRPKSIRALFYYNLTGLLIKRLEILIADRANERMP